MATEFITFNRPQPHRLYYEVNPINEHPLDVYESWANEIGVEASGSEQSISSHFNIVELAVPFYKKFNGSPQAVVDQSGQLMLYQNYPVPQTYENHNINGRTAQITVPYPPILISFMLGNREMTGGKVRSSADTTIMYGEPLQTYWNGRYNAYGKFAVKIKADQISYVSLWEGQNNNQVTPRDICVNVLDSSSVLHSKTIQSGIVGQTYQSDFYITQYQVTGTIDETMALHQFDVFVQDALSGIIIDKTMVSTVTDHTFDIRLGSNNPVTAVVLPKAYIRIPQSNYSIGDVIYPGDPKTTPYYFMAMSGGQSGGSEPNWDTTINSITNDGDINWQCKERIAQPVAHSPLIPIEVN